MRVQSKEQFMGFCRIFSCAAPIVAESTLLGEALCGQGVELFGRGEFLLNPVC
jgi:hypothetical protein